MDDKHNLKYLASFFTRDLWTESALKALSHTITMVIPKKSNSGMDVEKEEPLLTVGGSPNYEKP